MLKKGDLVEVEKDLSLKRHHPGLGIVVEARDDEVFVIYWLSSRRKTTWKGPQWALKKLTNQKC